MSRGVRGENVYWLPSSRSSVAPLKSTSPLSSMVSGPDSPETTPPISCSSLFQRSVPANLRNVPSYVAVNRGLRPPDRNRASSPAITPRESMSASSWSMLLS